MEPAADGAAQGKGCASELLCVHIIICSSVQRRPDPRGAPGRVGNELGAGSAAGARCAMGVAGIVAPALWAAEACVLGAPAAQRALVSLFAAPGDVALLAQLRQLLQVVLAMLLFDGLQTVLQGVVQARALRRAGARPCAAGVGVADLPQLSVLGMSRAR